MNQETTGQQILKAVRDIKTLLTEHAEITSRHANAMQDSIEHIEDLLVKITRV